MSHSFQDENRFSRRSISIVLSFLAFFLRDDGLGRVAGRRPEALIFDFGPSVLIP